jgi:hypothetical protein
VELAPAIHHRRRVITATTAYLAASSPSQCATPVMPVSRSPLITFRSVIVMTVTPVAPGRGATLHIGSAPQPPVPQIPTVRQIIQDFCSLRLRSTARSGLQQTTRRSPGKSGAVMEAMSR